MTSTAAGGRNPRSLATRTLLMLAAAAVVSALGLVGVDTVTRPVASASGEVQREPGEEEMPREPHFEAGLGELAVQVALVAGIAVAGRKILKIRL